MAAGDLSVSQVKAIVQQILSQLTCSHVSERLLEARDRAGNDMVLYMQLVFPLVADIQAQVLDRHGFQGDSGSVRFTQLARAMEVQDGDLAQLNSHVREYFLPSLASHSSSSSSPPPVSSSPTTATTETVNGA